MRSGQFLHRTFACTFISGKLIIHAQNYIRQATKAFHKFCLRQLAATVINREAYEAVLVSKLRFHLMIIIVLFYVVVHSFTDAAVSFCEGLKFHEARELVPIPASFRDKSIHKYVKRKRAGYGNKSPYFNVKNSWTYVFVCLHSTGADRIPDVSPFMTITFFERERFCRCYIYIGGELSRD